MERYIASSGSGLFDALLSDLLHKIANLPYDVRDFAPSPFPLRRPVTERVRADTADARERFTDLSNADKGPYHQDSRFQERRELS